MARPPSFIGTGWSFPPGFDDRQLSALLVDHEQDIEESLHILLSTRPGERVMHPGYGCPLRRMVFEQIDSGTLAEIRDLIGRAVRQHEPRIELHEVQTDTRDLSEGVLRLQLLYTIRRTNDRRNWVYPFYLHDGSETGAQA